MGEEKDIIMMEDSEARERPGREQYKDFFEGAKEGAVAPPTLPGERERLQEAEKRSEGVRETPASSGNTESSDEDDE